MDTNETALFTTEKTIEGSNSSSQSNDSENTQFINDTRKDIFSIMMPIVLALCLVSLLLSSCVLCSTPFVKRPMSPSIRLSLSLSAANAAFSAIVFVGTVIHSYLPAVFNINFPHCLNLIVEAIRMGVILVQVYHLLAVALIHYLGTLRPLQYASTLTPQCLKVIIAVLWTFPIIGIFVGFSSIPDQGFQSEGCSNNYFRLHGIYFRYVWSLIYFGPTVVLVIVYVHIFVILKRRGRNLVDREHRRNLYKNMKTVKTTFLFVVTFLIGWSPAVLAFLLICKDCLFQIEDLKISMAIFSTTYILIILKVFGDTFIYALRLPEIREALRILFSSVAHCTLSSSRDVSGRRFRMSSTGTSTCRSTYLNSITSASLGSEKEKSLKKAISSSGVSKPYVTVEMEPLYEKVDHAPLMQTVSEKA